MKKFCVGSLMAGLLMMAGCAKDDHTYALIETEFGNIKVMLYNTTPKHRDNFIKLAKENFYEDLLFHRVIKDFMIQGGDPDSRNAAPGAPLGMGGPGYLLDAEIGAPHIRGTLAAARTQNPMKQSSGSQFYIVQGRQVNDQLLDNIELQKGIKYNDAQRQLYKEKGGAPFLDNDYTVFGEVVEGIEVVDAICDQATGQGDRPVNDVKMNIRILD